MTINPFDPQNAKALKDKSSEIQSKMAETQKKLATIEVEGKAGVEDYAVKVYLNGHHEATKVTIDQQLLQQPTQVLCELIASAITDASHKIEVAIQKEMLSLFQNFGLPDENKKE